MATVSGPSFATPAGSTCQSILDSFPTLGFEATSLAHAINVVNEMIKAKEDGCQIFLTYTSNLISSGVREILRFLTEHRLVDGIISTAGGIEEDFIKCLAKTYVGDFSLDGVTLRKQGINRTGNLLVPNNNYCAFEDWFMPIVKAMHKEQEEKKDIIWQPSTVVERMGHEIQGHSHEEAVYYWAAHHKIPVYCPSLTDGSMGDMMFFYSIANEGLVVDVCSDMVKICDQVAAAKKIGVVSLGGGMPKHHILNACEAEGKVADFFVNITTGTPWDGSESGATLEQDIANGRISDDRNHIAKVQGEATLVFPLLVAKTFAPYWHSKKPASN
eukprot:TRINITY_DN38008_c0_g1_i2.p2 TRINITY_DN38008_c0_g1~~TRINITY_DN38008_c0_g1_i2.p2  ORF type:complete len:329 (-),score=51.16 TRINITY_DN38008_c0_g1_i2:1439-2425(-)